MTEHPPLARQRATFAVNALCAQGMVSIETANWGRDIIAEVFDTDTVYCSVAPDDGDLTFYWLAGTRSLGIDLYADGWLWCHELDNGSRRSANAPKLPDWFAPALADFSAWVQRENPRWREQRG